MAFTPVNLCPVSCHPSFFKQSSVSAPLPLKPLKRQTIPPRGWLLSAAIAESRRCYLTHSCLVPLTWALLMASSRMVAVNWMFSSRVLANRIREIIANPGIAK